MATLNKQSVAREGADNRFPSEGLAMGASGLGWGGGEQGGGYGRDVGVLRERASLAGPCASRERFQT